MRQHYTYELQEDRIRKTFRDFSTPLTEEAWQKFSLFSEAQPKPQAGKFSGLEFRISRRVALTAAASLVVLLLALLIINFAGNGGSGETQKAVSSEPFVPVPQADEPELVSLPSAPSQEKPVIAATGEKEAPSAQKPEVVKAKKSSMAMQSANPADTSIALVQAKPTRTASAKKKVRIDSSDDDLLQTVQLPDIRPSLLPAEPEEDILAN